MQQVNIQIFIYWLAGGTITNLTGKVLKTMLWDYWGIQGHETAIKEMRSLIDEGMRASYRRKMELLSHKYKDATEVQLIEEARKTNQKPMKIATCRKC